MCSAHDVAVSKQHKSISASDVLRALEVIELGDLAEKLQNELVGTNHHQSNCTLSLLYLTVYRELSKPDKKKVPSNTAAAGSASAPVPGGSGAKPKTTASGSLSISIPALKNAKGKAKADPPASEELPVPVPTESISSGRPGTDMDIDDPVGAEEAPIHGEDAEEVQEEDDIEEDAPQELVDKMALEEEELRRDANALDDGPGPSHTGDQDHQMD